MIICNNLFKYCFKYGIIILAKEFISMKSRMEKYYNTDTVATSRTQKNADLYKDSGKPEIEDFNVNSNVKVLGVNAENIDIEKVKEILDKKYRENVRRNPTPIEPSEEENVPLSLEETREYNITAILERAKEQKDVDYEQERLKKIRDTQYDILNNLNLKDLKKDELEDTPTENELVELIHTITERELQKKDVEPLDILEDLKGSDNTVVLDGLKEDIDTFTNAIDISESKELALAQEKNNEEIQDNIEIKSKNKVEIDKSFFTNSMSFSQSDFDDFNDLKEEMKSNKLLIRILIIIVVLAIIAGLVLVVYNLIA